MLDLRQSLETLSALREDEIVLSTFTSSVLWDEVSRRSDLDLPFWGPMGKASSAALGIVLALPHKRVWVFDGDGSLLMNLGTLVTIAAMRPANLVHVLMDNRIYWTTGGQPVPGADRVDFPTIARGAGFTRVYTFEDVEQYEREIAGVMREQGPVFVDLRVKVGPLPGRLPKRTMRQAIPDFWRNVRALAATGA